MFNLDLKLGWKSGTTFFTTRPWKHCEARVEVQTAHALLHVWRLFCLLWFKCKRTVAKWVRFSNISLSSERVFERTCSSLMRATSCMMPSVFHLRRAIAQYHQTICELLSHFQYFKFKTVYVSHRPFNDVNASLFVCLHGCAIARA